MRQLLAKGLRAAVVPVAVLATVGAAAAAPGPKPTAYVDPAGVCHLKTPCYTTIQDAVNHAAPGDVILAYKGVYHEHVVIDRALTLQGEGAKLDGDGTGTVLTIQTNGAVVTKLDVTNGGPFDENGPYANGGAGVAVFGTGNQLVDLKISYAGNGIRFPNHWDSYGGASGNVVAKTDVSHTSYAIDNGDSGNSGNQFLNLKLHDNGTGFNAYAGSDGLLLRDSTITKNGTGVAIGWSGGWTVEDNVIRDNTGPGVVTDTVWSGSVVHNYIVKNGEWGVWEAGYGSTVWTTDNRIEANGLSGIALCIGAHYNQVHHNMLVGNGRYGIEVCSHPYWNGGNDLSGNFLFSGTGALGDALDDQGSNGWAGNYYGLNTPWVSPFTILGAAGAQDATPLAQADLPKPAAKADCKNDGWWLLTNGTLPFKDEGACTKFVK